MFKKSTTPVQTPTTPVERVTSVLGPGINWSGNLGGKGGIRIEGTFEGEVAIHGLVVIGETGRLTCKNLRANSVIVAGAVRGNITAEKLEIRSTGRVWGDVVTTAFATEEGAFLRGQVRMEDKVELQLEEPPSEPMRKDMEADKDPSPEPTKPLKIRKVAGGQ
jgi:cytoskeletal protein CcmA (bactofilin family)